MMMKKCEIYFWEGKEMQPFDHKKQINESRNFVRSIIANNSCHNKNINKFHEVNSTKFKF